MLTQRAAGLRAGLVAGIVWAISPIAIAHAMGGLETSLALFFLLILVLIADDFDKSPTTKNAVKFGIICAASLLARIDLAIPVAFLSVWQLLKQRWKKASIAALIALLCLAPWWIYQYIHFGSPIPESGAGTRFLTHLLQDIYLAPSFWIPWAAGYLLPGPIVDWHWLREIFTKYQYMGYIALGLSLIIPWFI